MSHNHRSAVPRRLGLRRGDRVRVRSYDEILATLDDRGELDDLPFMPEMLRYCGQVATVAARAHKTCDTIEQTGGRSMRDAVHLDDLRCDGSGHGDCQARCLMFWKESWLERVADNEQARAAGPDTARDTLTRRLAQHASAPTPDADTPPKRYYCQTTELLRATRALAWWNPWQYIRDVASGNVRAGRAAHVLVSAALRRLMQLGLGYRVWRRLYDWLQARTTGEAYPFGRGSLPDGSKTPTARLDLQPGEQVRVRSHEEILATMTRTNRNRGLFFDVEMVPYCGDTFTVDRRVERIINERSGEMMHFKNPCIMLTGVVCQSRYSDRRLLCPRAIPSYWREIWLERLEPPSGEAAGESPAERR